MVAEEGMEQLLLILPHNHKPKAKSQELGWEKPH